MRGIGVKKKRRKAKKVYRQMYQTYVFMLCVPILFSIAFFYYAYGEISSNTQMYTGNLNNTIKNICDTKIQYYEGIINQLNANEDVKNLIRHKDFETPQSYWYSYVVRNTLENLKISMQAGGLECESVFIYLPNNDKMYYDQTVMELDFYNEEILHLSAQNVSALRDYMQNLKTKSIFSSVNKEGTPYFMILRPVVSSNGRVGDGVIGVAVDINKIEIESQTEDWRGDLEWLILDDQNHAVRIPKQWQEAVPDFDALELENGQEAEINGIKYLVSVVSSEVCDWKYLLLAPSELINQSTNRIRAVYILCVGISLVVGWWMMKKAMEITYDPLEKVMSSLRQSGEEQEDTWENEFEYLNKQIYLLVEKDEFHDHYVRNVKKDIRNFTLERLITGIRIGSDKERCDGNVLNKFEKNNNLVQVFMIQEQQDERDMGSQSLKNFIVSNVAEECIRKQFETEFYDYGDRIIALVQMPENSDEERKRLSELVEEAYDFVYKKFQMKFYTLEGGIHYGLEGIHRSYLEACLSEKIALMLKEPYVRYEEIKDNSVQKYRYSFEMEEMLRNAIDSGKREFAVSIVEGLLRDSLDDSIQERRCLLYGIFSTLLKVSAETGIKFDKLYEFENTVLHAEQETIQTYFTDMIDHICKKEGEIDRASQKNKLCEEVNAYIEAHFTEPELNISQMALEFEISPSYLSAQYKKNTGESILDVIKNRRIEYAKQLLNDGMSVADVAVQTGFRESATFVRAFKKCTGLTPGQMKKIDKI